MKESSMKKNIKQGIHVFAIIEGIKIFGTVAEAKQGSIILNAQGRFFFADIDTVTIL